MRRYNTKRQFKKEWSPEFAYGVGLLVTDGSLSKDRRHFAFVSKDMEQMENFKKAFKINNRICKKTSHYCPDREYFVIQFGNARLYDWLLEMGLMPNKTKQIVDVDIPDLYLPDFIRGHIDGDGDFRVFQDSVYPRSQRLYTRFTSGSFPHLIWLRDRIGLLLGLGGSIRVATRAYQLSYAKEESKILLKSIYYNKNVLCLSRKRKIVEQFL